MPELTPGAYSGKKWAEDAMIKGSTNMPKTEQGKNLRIDKNLETLRNKFEKEGIEPSLRKACENLFKKDISSKSSDELLQDSVYEPHVLRAAMEFMEKEV